MIINKTIEDLQIENMDQYYQEILLRRAIPDIRDGLNLIQRRILYSMYEKNYTKEFIKSANVVGCAISYHPHGDASIYETLVNMTQSFSNNQNLIEPHGNFGSIYGDPPAASRYTEVKLNKFSINYLLDNLRDNSIDFVPSFDNRNQEPSILPSKLPLILINGSFGIGGGYMSSIPPHNIKSVVKAIKLIIKNPEIDIKELIEKSNLYPSFPTNATIVNKNEILRSYTDFKKSSKNTIKVRAKIEKDKKKHCLIITEIPYMKTLDIVKKSILDVVNDKENKKIVGIKNIVDASEKGKINLIIYCNKEYDLDLIRNQLFQFTSCQTTIPISLVAVNNQHLSIYNNIKEILEEWLEFRKETIKRIKRNNIKNIEYRCHILDALLIVLQSNNIDTLISIVKKGTSKQDIIEKIQKKFNIDEIQATYISELKLYSLNKFEINRLQEERDNLSKELEEEIDFLKNNVKINNYIIEDLETALNSKYVNKDNNNTEITNEDSLVIEDIIEDEDFLLILTKNGYIKKIQNNIRNQKRNGTGRSIGKIKENDIPKKIINCNSKDNILLFTSSGLLFKYKCYEIENSSLQSYGKKISSMVKNEDIVNVISLSNEELLNDNLHIISSSKLGKIKMTSIQKFKNFRSSGIIYSKVNEDDEIVSVNIVDITDDFSVLSVNSRGNAINISKDDIPINERTSIGSLIFDSSEIKNGVTVIDSIVLNSNTNGILIATQNGFGKRIDKKEFSLQKRAGKGRIATKFKKESDSVAFVLPYSDENVDNDLMVIASNSIINIKLSDIKVSLRPAFGCPLKKLSKNEIIIDGCLI